VVVCAWVAGGALAGCTLAGCTVQQNRTHIDGGNPRLPDGGFRCLDPGSQACIGNNWFTCTGDGEFLTPVRVDCAATRQICVDSLGCALCNPGGRVCMNNDVVTCADDGMSTTLVEHCDISMGRVCVQGQCVDQCEQAVMDHSYVGCEFYAADLDNAAIGAGRDASSQQYAIVVSNPGQFETTVTIERDTGTFGGASTPEMLMQTTIGPGDLEVFRLPRREVDGSSSMLTCTSDAVCNQGERCWCAGGMPAAPGLSDCHCRNAATTLGLNDGTHSALSRNAYRVRSTLPIVAYQFNPLDNVGVFSNDASLLVPVSGLGTTYTVLGWPQTIADSTDPAHDFNPSAHDEDLRVFLTIVGTADATHLDVTLGPQVVEVPGVPGFPGPLHSGQMLSFDMGPFDVVNLETHGFNGDFTGTAIQATSPVSVFVGSEASDAPRFDDLANRQCCADHLEEQVYPDETLGRHFFIGRTPARSVALNHAFVTSDSVGEFNEPEYVRLYAVDPGTTTITTTLPIPNDTFSLQQGHDLILTATQDMEIMADHRLAVVQVMASGQATGIPNEYPGGDPSLISVPPVEQYRRDYVFLTPQYYAFDFVTIVAPAPAELMLDGAPLDPAACTVGPADGVMRHPGDPDPSWLTYHCQLSFPDVIGLPNVQVEDGVQHDGYHTLQATQPVSLLVSGFDSFVSYAYMGGLNLTALPH
jgi:hypothetical protein